MMRLKLFSLSILFMTACSTTNRPGITSGKPMDVTFVTLDPGHFHAALVQKTMLPGVNPNVYVYSPAGPDLDLHLKRIDAFNTRADAPANWKENLYTGNDFFEKMIAEKKGNLVVMAGNNQKKTEYIFKTVNAGMNVLADKPMAINKQGFELLKKAFETAGQKNVLLYDIMTERFEINTVLQKEFSQLKTVFGELEKGTPENPAITKESVHYFYKFVSGSILQRPGWFMDVRQQGEGIVDVTTHLVDLVQWEAFPNQVIDYNKDVQIGAVKRWPTTMSLSQFEAITKQSSFPAYLKGDLANDTTLNVFSNGEINYKLKGVHAKVSVIWGYKAPEGTGDTHYSIMRGTRANLIIRQGQEQGFKPMLYIEPVQQQDANFERDLDASMASITKNYPGVGLKKTNSGWQVMVPEKYNTGHEAHFGQVTEKFLEYLKAGKLPHWEVPNMIAKYYITTSALEKAGRQE